MNILHLFTWTSNNFSYSECKSETTRLKLAIQIDTLIDPCPANFLTSISTITPNASKPQHKTTKWEHQNMGWGCLIPLLFIEAKTTIFLNWGKITTLCNLLHPFKLLSVSICWPSWCNVALAHMSGFGQLVARVGNRADWMTGMSNIAKGRIRLLCKQVTDSSITCERGINDIHDRGHWQLWKLCS